MSKPVQIKVNVSGSWANLVTVSPVRLGEVQEACLQLAANLARCRSRQLTAIPGR